MLHKLVRKHTFPLIALALLGVVAFPSVTSAAPVPELGTWFLCLWGTWTAPASLTAACAPERQTIDPHGPRDRTPIRPGEHRIAPYGQASKVGHTIDPNGQPGVNPTGDEGVKIDPHG